MDDVVSWPDGAAGAALKWLIIALVVYGAVLWIALVAWAYRDIRLRSRDPIMQFISVLLVLVFFLPGHWIYLILRPRYTLKDEYERTLEEEALLQELEEQHACANCRRRVQDSWLMCPSCGTRLKEPCTGCEKPLSYSWIACPFCGAPQPHRAAPGAVRGRPPARGAVTSAQPGMVRRPNPGTTVRRAPPPGPPELTIDTTEVTNSERAAVPRPPAETPANRPGQA